MLMALQQHLQAASFGDPAGFAASVAQLRPTRLAPDKALYIHRATTASALTGLLRAAYPATCDWMGEAAFLAVADAFQRTHPPILPVLSAYGDGFAATLGPEFQPAAAADLAAHQAYFAIDTEPFPLEQLPADDPPALARLRLAPVPSAHLLTAPIALLRRWQQSRPDLAALPPATDAAASSLLIWRGPDLLVASTLLTAAEAVLFDRLAAGDDMLAALEAAGTQGPLDLAAFLVMALTRGIFAHPAPDGSP